MALLETLARTKPEKLPGPRTPGRAASWHIPLKDRRAVLQKTMTTLPERKRLVVALRHYEGLNLQEMAQALCTDVETVRALLDDAVARLARALIMADDKARKKDGTPPRRRSTK
jgi:DNA-directed RNA polymerase specialized sigma24 family protein